MITFLVDAEGLHLAPYTLPKYNAIIRDAYHGSDGRLLMVTQFLWRYPGGFFRVWGHERFLARELMFEGFQVEDTPKLAAAVLKAVLEQDFEPIIKLLTPEKDEHHDPAKQ